MPIDHSGSAREDDLKKPSGPSGATDVAGERTKKFDEEGGDQPQAPSQAAVDQELQQVQQQHEASSAQQSRPAGVEDDSEDADAPLDRESVRSF